MHAPVLPRRDVDLLALAALDDDDAEDAAARRSDEERSDDSDGGGSGSNSGDDDAEGSPAESPVLGGEDPGSPEQPQRLLSSDSGGWARDRQGVMGVPTQQAVARMVTPQARGSAPVAAAAAGEALSSSYGVSRGGGGGDGAPVREAQRPASRGGGDGGTWTDMSALEIAAADGGVGVLHPSANLALERDVAKLDVRARAMGACWRFDLIWQQQHIDCDWVTQSLWLLLARENAFDLSDLI